MIIVSEGSRATVPNWPFGQQPFVVGHCCWLLCVVFSFADDSWLLSVVAGCCLLSQVVASC